MNLRKNLKLRKATRDYLDGIRCTMRVSRGHQVEKSISTNSCEEINANSNCSSIKLF